MTPETLLESNASNNLIYFKLIITGPTISIFNPFDLSELIYFLNLYLLNLPIL
jgi:hypothetical protein